MKTRLAAGVVAGMLVFGLAGCTGSAPKPSPTPTPPFANADAAYKAAEATYRAYVDALNNVDLNDPKTFESVYKWLLGDALEGDKAALMQMNADHQRKTGGSKITLIKRAQAASPEWGDVALYTCLDVSHVSLLREDGTSAVDPERPDVQALTVTLSRDAASSTG